MKKRVFMLLLAVCMMVSLLPQVALAEEDSLLDAKTGTCGEGISWSLQDGTLTVSGSGEMADGAPWAEYENQIERVVLTGGITKIGEAAFYDCDRLEEIDFGGSLVEIGEQAFYGCDDLTVIHLPATFRKFGKECFRACNSLQRVYCDGGMPRFETSCLWTDNYISVFYPPSNVWPQEYTSQLISNFSGRLGIMMGTYDESVLSELDAPGEAVEAAEREEKTEETTAATEAAEVATEAATEPVVTQPAIVLIQPETEPEEVTEAPTEAPAEVPTQAPTEAETQAPTEAQPEQTQPMSLEEAVETLEGKSWIGLVMIGGVLLFLIAGAVIFRSATKKNGRYRR